MSKLLIQTNKFARDGTIYNQKFPFKQVGEDYVVATIDMNLQIFESHLESLSTLIALTQKRLKKVHSKQNIVRLKIDELTP